ncbi:MAG: YeiH family protein [Pseudomonadota bacterium]
MLNALSSPRDAGAKFVAFIRTIAPGTGVAIVLAVTAKFLSEHYGAPAMLMALLLGMAFHFLAKDVQCGAGVEYSSKGVLRIGVALLGARISTELVAGVGAELIALTIAGVIATILFGLLAARVFGRGWRMALLTGGSVAICGASAAMAIASVLPKNEFSERNLIFTVLGVTILSTIAMVIYPLLTEAFAFDDRDAGLFFGAAIHDVAQVVGAGFSVSQEAGETATLVKLMRVTMLAPVVLVLSLALRSMHDAGPDGQAKRPPLIPTFVIGFLALATLNSIGVIPEAVSTGLAELSRWMLLIAIAAVGMKIDLQRMFAVGGGAIALIVAETMFIALFILGGMELLS